MGIGARLKTRRENVTALDQPGIRDTTAVVSPPFTLSYRLPHAVLYLYNYYRIRAGAMRTPATITPHKILYYIGSAFV